MSKYNAIVVLTGAGISAESGINTFRAADGLWEEHRVEDVATPTAFARNPELVQRFYNERRRPIAEQTVAPNPAHFALAKLEQEFTGSCTLVTQNIDNLHTRAGSKNVYHMHGEILKVRCKQSGKIFARYGDLTMRDVCECCQSPGNLRPHIVWFGEMPLYMDEIQQAIEACDLFIAIGTSGNVYPAAGFVQLARHAGAETVEINLEQSNVANDFEHAIYGKAGEVLPAWVDDFLSR